MNSTPTVSYPFEAPHNTAQHMAAVALRPPLTPSNPCEHGVAQKGRFCKKCVGSGICPKTLSAKQFCKCEDESCGSSLCVHKVSKYRCKREGCRTKATAICEHGRIKYDCLEGDCPGSSSLCKHGNLRASRCARCLEE